MSIQLELNSINSMKDSELELFLNLYYKERKKEIISQFSSYFIYLEQLISLNSIDENKEEEKNEEYVKLKSNNRFKAHIIKFK